MAALVQRDAVTLALTTPIDAHGEAVQSIVLRPLTVEDFDRVGYPMRIGSDGLEPIADRVSALIARLGNIPRSSVGQMNVADWHSALEVILSFFGMAGRTS